MVSFYGVESIKVINKEHRKKMIAPIVITVFFLLYLAIYLVLVFSSVGLSPIILLLAIPLVMLGVGLVKVLLSRIKEIRSGEEDDLSNY